MSTERLCLYCGNPTGKVRKGDHLVPNAIGGTITTKDVCPTCNNNVLSDIDRELCSRSPLCLVAAKEIDGYVAHAWDVDEHDHNLLLEGRPDFIKSSFSIFPQMIVMPYGEQFRADWKELRDFGLDKFQTLFSRRLRRALWEYEHGDKRAIIFRPIEYNDDLLARYTHFPRFFVRGTIAEACSDKTIELGYLSQATKRFALARIASGLNQRQEMRTDVRLGTSLPTVRCFFDAGKVWRALAKIAVNLLHHYCRYTQVNRSGFARVIAEIIGDRQFRPDRLERSGFVCHENVATIASDAKSHSFRLCWEDGLWNATMGFFGGQIGAAVKFPGPNKESWRMLDITAPIHSRQWRMTTSSLIVPARFNIEWLDLNKMIVRGGFVKLGA